MEDIDEIKQLLKDSSPKSPWIELSDYIEQAVTQCRENHESRRRAISGGMPCPPGCERQFAHPLSDAYMETIKAELSKDSGLVASLSEHAGLDALVLASQSGIHGATYGFFAARGGEPEAVISGFCASIGWLVSQIHAAEIASSTKACPSAEKESRL